MFLESQVKATNVLESSVAELCSWFLSNRFMINDTKTEFLIIDRPPSSVGKDDNLFYRQSSIKLSESVRIFRSLFDAQMRMNVHIDRQTDRHLYLVIKLRVVPSGAKSNLLSTGALSTKLHYLHGKYFIKGTTTSI